MYICLHISICMLYEHIESIVQERKAGGRKAGYINYTAQRRVCAALTTDHSLRRSPTGPDEMIGETLTLQLLMEPLGAFRRFLRRLSKQ